MANISAELDQKLAEMIRNHPANALAAKINADAKATIARTNAAVKAASKIKPDEEVLAHVADQSTKAKAIAAEAAQTTKDIEAAVKSVSNVKPVF